MFKEPRSSLPQYFISPKIEIKKSSIHGIGVFAKEEIKRLDMVESSPAVVFNMATSDHLYSLNDWRHVLMDYPFHWEEGYLAFCLGYGGVYNHSSLESNITWRVNHQLESIEFTAQRNIETGEELLIRYCVSYDANKLWFVSELDEEEDSRAERGEKLQHPRGTLSRYVKTSTNLFERVIKGVPPLSGSSKDL